MSRYINPKTSLPIGGNHNIISIIRTGIIPPIKYGFLRPHRVFVRSDKKPINGSLNAFHIVQKLNASVIVRGCNPTAAK